MTVHRASFAHIPNPTTDIPISENYAALILHDTDPRLRKDTVVTGNSELLEELNNGAIYGYGTPALCMWHAKVGSLYPLYIYFLLKNKNSNAYHLTCSQF